jgi:hypothetical protein
LIKPFLNAIKIMWSLIRNARLVIGREAQRRVVRFDRARVTPPLHIPNLLTSYTRGRAQY